MRLAHFDDNEINEMESYFTPRGCSRGVRDVSVGVFASKSQFEELTGPERLQQGDRLDGKFKPKERLYEQMKAKSHGRRVQQSQLSKLELAKNPQLAATQAMPISRPEKGQKRCNEMQVRHLEQHPF